MLRTIRTIGSVRTVEGAGSVSALDWIVAARECMCRWAAIPIVCALLISTCAAQEETRNDSSRATVASRELNVNWLYGSYVPKDVPLISLNGHQRFKLYLMQTYTTPGIYIKTTLFALHDQISNSNPEWGDDFAGFAKRLGDRQVQFIIQNSITSLGNGMLGWEPRYDRCRCAGLWPRTRHALVRNFVTYDRSEKVVTASAHAFPRSLRVFLDCFDVGSRKPEVGGAGLSGRGDSSLCRRGHQLAGRVCSGDCGGAPQEKNEGQVKHRISDATRLHS